MKLIISKTCVECNTMAIKLKCHEPTDKEIQETENECGGVCVTTNVLDIEINKTVYIDLD